MEPWVNVTDFGAKGDGVTPDDQAFQTALDLPGEHSVIVPPGQVDPHGIRLPYRIDGSLNVPYQLHLVQGATLMRVADSPSTAPVIFLSNREATLVGGGEVATQKNAPRGVVSVGSRDLLHKQNTTLTRVDGIKLRGAGMGVGLNLDSVERYFHDGTGTNYLGTFSNINIAGFEVGIKVGELCNGHIFSNIIMLNLSRFGYWSLDNTENTFLGGFVHNSHNVTVIKLERVGYNIFYGIQGEPGSGSRFFEDDADCLVCQVFGHDNCPHGPLKNSPTLTYLTASQLEVGEDLVVKAQTTNQGEFTHHITQNRLWTFPDQSGTVALQGTSQPASTAVTVDQLRRDFNLLLEKLRAAGVLEDA